MWPSIPTFGRNFGNISCPAGAKCELPYCIFSHDRTKNAQATPEPAAKRVKLDDSIKEATVCAGSSGHDAQNPVFVGSIVSKEDTPTVNKAISKPSDALPRSATRAVSPPPPKAIEANMTPKPQSEAVVSLTPRKLTREPATFARRLTMLKALRQYMTPLNDKMGKAVKPEIKAIKLSDNQLNKLAIEEEEKIALEKSAVYENIIKQRLVALKKMTPEEWLKERRAVVAKEKGDPPKKPPKRRVDTGLSPKEEITFLSTLISPQTGLDAHGYVTKMPTDVELEEARATQDSAGSWEECDRCSTRFQVFPERREEDGALTTGGKCTYHWGKRIFPKKVKGAAPEPTRFACCNEPVGSPPCTTHDTHVFKISGAKRLSLVMPFIETPENDEVKPHTAICFDCEMGYTTRGLELLRLTAVSWPNHKPILDILVRPIGYLLDVNTRFSGVTAEQYLNAKPYDPQNPPKLDPKDLHIVDSPHIARDLFLSHICPSTPVLGHALENDLNAIRLIHPTIVDTVLLYPHRQGLPLRHGLRTLAKNHLGLNIQQGGAAGHDSYEDARTTGELVRYKIAENWKSLKAEGWEIRDDGLYPPIPLDQPPPLEAPPAPSMVPPTNFMQAQRAEKRTFSEYEGGAHGNE